MFFSGNLKHIEECNEKPQIPIIISEVNSTSANDSILSEKKAENSIETTSTKFKAKSELKLDKKPHKKHSDKTINLEKNETEKTKETKDKDKKSTKQLKHSTSSDKLKHREPSEQQKHKSKEGGHKTKKEKLIKKHSKENVLEEKVKTPGTSSEKLPKQVTDTSLPRKSFVKAKPPNVLVYADSSETRGNVKNVLHEVLNKNRYTIYELPATGSPYFADNSTLVVVCGNVNPNLTSHLLSYFLNGGNLLCLCSDFLNSVLHTFTTAEVFF